MRNDETEEEKKTFSLLGGISKCSAHRSIKKTHGLNIHFWEQK